MGKGDRKTRRGKTWRGTHGKTRPRKEERARARRRHGLKPSQLKNEQTESS